MNGRLEVMLDRWIIVRDGKILPERFETEQVAQRRANVGGGIVAKVCEAVLVEPHKW